MLRFIKLFITILIQKVIATRFDNSLIGSPLVFCEENLIRIEFETLEPFSGKVFVKGEYHNQQCAQVYRQGKINGKNNIYHGVQSNEQKEIIHNSNDIIKSRNLDLQSFAQRESATVHTVFGHFEKTSSNWTGTGGSTSHKKLSRVPYPSAFGGIQEESRLENSLTKQTRAGSPIKVFQKPQSIENIRGNVEQISSAPSVCPPCACESPDIRSRRNTNQLTFAVRLGECNAKRERILVPPSLITSFVIIVSFHESFITKLDRAYHIQCAYTESSRAVLADLNVSMSVPSSINSTVTPPKCVYNIMDMNGRSAQDVRVGDLVKHQWTCHTDEPGLYRMLVHDCYVESGLNEKHKIIDDDGCTLDKYTFSTPTYTENLTVSVDSYMFKFPDKSTMDFQCAIKLCSIHDVGCVIKTPEKCDQLNRKRRWTENDQNDYAVLYSNSLTVLDKGNMEDDSFEFEEDSLHLATGKQSPISTIFRFAENGDMCFSHNVYGFVIFLLTFISTLSLTLIVAQKLTVRNEFVGV